MSTHTSELYKDTDKFMAVFPKVVSAAVKKVVAATNTSSVGPWIKELLEYNSHGGHKNRGLTAVTAYQMLEDKSKLSEESVHRACILGWCIELLQTSLVLPDDIIDNSLKRRGSPCWYKLPHVGLRAINDSDVLNGLTYHILQENFGKEPYYADLVNCLNEAILMLCLGQHLDFTMTRKYSQFTMESYKTIAVAKCEYFTYRLPFQCGLLLANKPLNDPFKSLKNITEDIAVLVMMQNDYMDCYGEEAVSGKPGTDIQGGKCSWLAVTALQRFNVVQRAEFLACYGRPNERDEQRVKQLYLDIQLPTIYEQAKQAYYQNITNRIQALPNELTVIPPSAMIKILDMVYYLRSK